MHINNIKWQFKVIFKVILITENIHCKLCIIFLEIVEIHKGLRPADIEQHIYPKGSWLSLGSVSINE